MLNAPPVRGRRLHAGLVAQAQDGLRAAKEAAVYASLRKLLLERLDPSMAAELRAQSDCVAALTRATAEAWARPCTRGARP